MPSGGARLPPEMIAHIQAWAEAGEPARAVKKLRASFELVNKDWYRTVDHLTHIVILSISDVARLAAKLGSAKLRAVLAAKTRSVWLEMGGVWRAKEVGRAANLIRWLVKTTTLVVDTAGGDDALAGDSKVGQAWCAALAKMASLRHFTMAGGTCTRQTLEG